MTLTDLQTLSPGMYNTKAQLSRHIVERTMAALKMGEDYKDTLKTDEEVRRYQEKIRESFITDCLGGMDFPDSPLEPEITGVIDEGGFTIEKIIFQSRPKVYVTCNLYLPKGITKPTGAVLFLCGHHITAKHESEYQIVCRYLVKAGLVVLSQDPFGQGERLSYYEPTLKTELMSSCLEHDYVGMKSWPFMQSSARYFLHDAMRGIDYLQSRPEVDGTRIGVTGNSGGGLQTTLLTLVDLRIAAAEPVTWMCSHAALMMTGGPADAEHIWLNFRGMGFEFEDMVIPMAPKPVLLLGTDYDFFPIEGLKHTAERCKKVWDVFGAGDNFEMFTDQYTHSYTRTLARKATEFFSKHLNGIEITTHDDNGINAILPSDLWCTKSGQIRGEIPDARFMLDEIQDEKRGNRDLKKAKEWLSEVVYKDRISCEINRRRLIMDMQMADGFVFEQYMWASQKDVFNYGVLLRPLEKQHEKIPVILAVWDNGTTDLAAHESFIRTKCAAGNAVFVLDASGMGNIEPNPTNMGNMRD
ncbi:MAG: hypothetical protein FWF15_10460, partial [Oscillospiraceae bacterium]|nr:hypothetical protein [Oscillospiraceae bacterium]